MKKFIKIFLFVVVVLFSWNIAVKDGYAENIIKIKDYTSFYDDVKYTKKDLMKDGKYGKYYEVTFPYNGRVEIYCGESQATLYLLNKKKQHMGQTDLFTPIKKYLTAGTYYFYIESNKSSVKPHFNFHYTGVIKETEPNNSIKKANDITKKLVYDKYGTNKMQIEGKFNGQKNTDTDYFKFTLKKELSYLFVNKININNPTTNFLLLDSKGKKIKLKFEHDEDDYYFEVYLPKGTYYVKNTIGSQNKNYSFEFSFDNATPPVKKSDVTITNNVKKEDTITLKNLVIGRKYRLYQYDQFLGEMIIWQKTFTASKGTKTIKVKQLGKKSGYILICAQDKSSYGESVVTQIPFTAEPLGITKAMNSSNIKVKNNLYGKKDIINFKNLVAGSTYSIYKDSNKKTKITSFKANSKTKKVTVKQLGVKAGAIYITVTKPKYSESKITKVKFGAEPTSKRK